MLRVCSLIIALTVAVPVFSQGLVLEPVTIEASTPEGLIAKGLGVQLEAVVTNFIAGRNYAQEATARTDRARRAFDNCGGCPDAREELEAAKSFERRLRGESLNIADDADRLAGGGGVARTLMKSMLGNESEELKETKYAERLVAFYCISQVGLDYNWKRIDDCKAKISPTKILNLQHESVQKCNMHTFGEKCRKNLPFKIVERTIAGVCHTKSLSAPEYALEASFLGDCRMGQISSDAK